MRPLSLACLSLLVALPGAALADPWKDESGHGRGRGEQPGFGLFVPLPQPRQREHAPPYGYPPIYAAPRIPQGHMPPPGECRLWFPDRPAGHQPPPGRC